jgi:hypothetical protein
MRQAKRDRLSAARKMSDIVVEIAKIGFKVPFREIDPAPKTAHILMFLASQAWNREVYAGQRHALS